VEDGAAPMEAPSEDAPREEVAWREKETECGVPERVGRVGSVEGSDTRGWEGAGEAGAGAVVEGPRGPPRRACPPVAVRFKGDLEGDMVDDAPRRAVPILAAGFLLEQDREWMAWASALKVRPQLVQGISATSLYVRKASSLYVDMSFEVIFLPRASS
jgi:hypothetical protein